MDKREVRNSLVGDNEGDEAPTFPLKLLKNIDFFHKSGGVEGIRTLETVPRLHP